MEPRPCNHSATAGRGALLPLIWSGTDLSSRSQRYFEGCHGPSETHRHPGARLERAQHRQLRRPARAPEARGQAHAGAGPGRAPDMALRIHKLPQRSHPAGHRPGFPGGARPRAGPGHRQGPALRLHHPFHRRPGDPRLAAAVLPRPRHQDLAHEPPHHAGAGELRLGPGANRSRQALAPARLVRRRGGGHRCAGLAGARQHPEHCPQPAMAGTGHRASSAAPGCSLRAHGPVPRSRRSTIS